MVFKTICGKIFEYKKILQEIPLLRNVLKIGV